MKQIASIMSKVSKMSKETHYSECTDIRCRIGQDVNEMHRVMEVDCGELHTFDREYLDWRTT